MANKKIIKTTEAELKILQVLWEHGASTVRFVNDQLNEKRESNQKEIGYTTTLKLMQLMNAGGLVKRNEESRTHIYESNVKKEAVQKRLLQKFMDATFRGSAKDLVLQALGGHDTSKEELDEIKELIARIEKKNN